MKKFICLAMLSIAFIANAQQYIVYKIKLQPNHKYASESKSIEEVEFHINADKKDADAVRSMLPPGMQLPLIFSCESHDLYKTDVGSVNKNKEAPFNIYYSESSLNVIMGSNSGQVLNLFNNLRLFARQKENGKLKLDSVSGAKTTPFLQEKASNKIQTIQDELQFPEKGLKIGDTFTQKEPLDIFLPGLKTPDMDVKRVYKLITVKDDKAYFDLTQTTVFNYYTKLYDVNMTGSGDGKVVYDLKNNYVISTLSNINCSFTIKGVLRKVEVKGVIKINANVDSTIE